VVGIQHEFLGGTSPHLAEATNIYRALGYHLPPSTLPWNAADGLNFRVAQLARPRDGQVHAGLLIGIVRGLGVFRVRPKSCFPHERPTRQSLDL